MRTRRRIFEQFQQTRFDVGRDGMFEHARFVMHLIPRHAEHVVQEDLGEPVSAQHARRDLEPVVG